MKTQSFHDRNTSTHTHTHVCTSKKICTSSSSVLLLFIIKCGTLILHARKQVKKRRREFFFSSLAILLTMMKIKLNNFSLCLRFMYVCRICGSEDGNWEWKRMFLCYGATTTVKSIKNRYFFSTSMYSSFYHDYKLCVFLCTDSMNFYWKIVFLYCSFL